MESGDRHVEGVETNMASPSDATHASKWSDAQEEKKTVQWNRAHASVVCGAVAGAVSRLVIAPLDVVKIRFQVQLEPLQMGTASKYTGIRQAMKTIVKEEGIAALWRGSVPGLLLTAPYTAIQFAVMSELKEKAAFGRKPAASFLQGAVAGVSATVGSYPFDLLRTTLAVQGEPKVYRGMGHAAATILKRKGVQGLYSGLGPTLVEIIPYAAIQFGVYDLLCASWKKTGLKDEKLGTFMCGLGAGLVAKFCTHPLDVVKKRFQVAGLERNLVYGARINEKAYRNLADCVFQILKKEGVGGLFKGAKPSLVKSAPAAAITFLVYESLMKAASAKQDEE